MVANLRSCAARVIMRSSQFGVGEVVPLNVLLPPSPKRHLRIRKSNVGPGTHTQLTMVANGTSLARQSCPASRRTTSSGVVLEFKGCIKANRTETEKRARVFRQIAAGTHRLPGNVLYDGENSCLSGLDYAKLFGDNAPSLRSVLTFTWRFIAVEVAHGSYQLEPTATDMDVLCNSRPDGLFDDHDELPVLGILHQLRHNLLHDLKSISPVKQLNTFITLFPAPSANAQDHLDRLSALSQRNPKFRSSIAPPFERVVARAYSRVV
ncbi:hypothetical protein PTI98_007013 [Pleurotus ostreatus]|nr:hypothetical protein PTI98_007013 [Pleurotus ostreatus]